MIIRRRLPYVESAFLACSPYRLSSHDRLKSSHRCDAVRSIDRSVSWTFDSPRSSADIAPEPAQQSPECRENGCCCTSLDCGGWSPLCWSHTHYIAQVEEALHALSTWIEQLTLRLTMTLTILLPDPVYLVVQRFFGGGSLLPLLHRIDRQNISVTCVYCSVIFHFKRSCHLVQLRWYNKIITTLPMTLSMSRTWDWNEATEGIWIYDIQLSMHYRLLEWLHHSNNKAQWLNIPLIDSCSFR